MNDDGVPMLYCILIMLRLWLVPELELKPSKSIMSEGGGGEWESMGAPYFDAPFRSFYHQSITFARL
jgi:hypothetical protein